MLSLNRLAFLALIASLVTACGGGGGSSSSSGSGSNPPSNQEPDSGLTQPTAPEYTGLKTASTIDRMAAATQADVVLHSLLDFTSAIGNPLLPVMTRLNFGSSSINDSVTHCDQGGFSLSGSYNEGSRQFDVVVSYNECVLGDTKYNGELAMQYVPASHSYLYFYDFDVYEFTDQDLELVGTIENGRSTLTNSRDRRVVDIAGKDYVLAKLDNYDSRYYELLDPLNQTFVTSEADINLSDIIWRNSRWVTQGDEWLLELNYDEYADSSLLVNADASAWTIESRMDQSIRRSSGDCRYIVDLEDDGVEELIFCGWDHTYIYDSVAQEVRWQLPENDASLKELFFFDINNDGVKEIIEHRGLNILVFDMTSETLLFSAEIYDNNYHYQNTVWVGQLDTDTAIELIAKEEQGFRLYELSASGITLESEIVLADDSIDGPFILVDTNNNDVKEILFTDDTFRDGVRLMLIDDNRTLVEKGQCDLDTVSLISQESETFDRNVIAIVNSDERLGSYSRKVAGLDIETCGKAWESSDGRWSDTTYMQWDWVNGKSRFLAPDYNSVFFVAPQ
ncbi:MAG: hypothetical protein MI867_19600 [Pseudomonadales bacterium]|nr:hypothetical protein [Pseudomonadales bacterium]